MTATTPSEARALAVRASRALAAAGQSDMVWGHAAVRDPDGRGIWIKAPGWGFEEIDEGRVHLVSFDAEVLDGQGAPHKECHIHLEILRRRPELECSVHTHAQAAVAFASLGTPLLPISHEGALFGGEDVPRFTLTGGLVTTPELGAALAGTLGDASAALIPKHGLVAAGTSVRAAVMHAVLLDRACQTQLMAMAAGPVRVHSDAAEAAAKRAECWPASQLDAGWEYLTRKDLRP
ncbi:class II aldolase/adducin family protein [Actinomadura barringtoniae]|uniref:Class II aldolase/adducin family protein n=1 Tax=Actinomadura barringtoniae TaxID=1427535 RepID=A0A939PS80_9ACTN|nr:class II aldolase/adducin family protein [Actinomadura barringtoniae]MBO2455279.1 class II aldolase/adducin family protein [Actinomadura barringtoniae]